MNQRTNSRKILRKATAAILAVLAFFCLFQVPAQAEDAQFEAYLTSQGFPESYKTELRKLHLMYPNWVFQAQITNIDWNTALAAESKLGISLVWPTYPTSWKSHEEGAYNWATGEYTVFDTGGWVAASKEIVAYYLDPRNYMDENSIFAFLDQSYDASTQNLAGVKSICKNTFLAGSFEEGGQTYSYPSVILSAGKQMGISPYWLAASMRLELGVNGSGSVSGTFPGYEGYYNYYNIGAYATDGMTAVERGLWYAKGGSDGSTTYYRPWNTRVKAIKGGAQFLANSYIKMGQNTLYLKKFNVMGSSLFTHQFMTNIEGAYSEANILASAFDDSMRAKTLVFKIPVYKNMPASHVIKPTKDGSPNNRLKSLSVSGYTLSPSFNMDTLSYHLTVPGNVNSITVNAVRVDSKAKLTGTGKITLNTAMTTINVKVTAENGSVRTYTIYVEKDGKIATLGNVVFGSNYNLTMNSTAAGTLTGFKTGLTAKTLLDTVTVKNGSFTAYSHAGVPLASSAVLGTGDVIYVYKKDGTIAGRFTIVLYGDVDGDGRINAKDLLKLSKYLKRQCGLAKANLRASDVNRDGIVSTADLAYLQKSLLGLAEIRQ